MTTMSWRVTRSPVDGRILQRESTLEHWWLPPSLSAKLPEGVRKVICWRLHRLSPRCSQVLTLAAVAGWGSNACRDDLLIAVFRSAYGNLGATNGLPGSMWPSPRPLPAGEGA